MFSPLSAVTLEDVGLALSTHTAIATAHHSNANDPTTTQKASLDANAGLSAENYVVGINDIPSGSCAWEGEGPISPVGDKAVSISGEAKPLSVANSQSVEEFYVDPANTAVYSKNKNLIGTIQLDKDGVLRDANSTMALRVLTTGINIGTIDTETLAFTNYIDFDAYGTPTLNGLATVYKNQFFPINTGSGQNGSYPYGNVKIADNNAGSVGVWHWSAADDASRYLHLIWNTPCEWKQETTVYPYTYWHSLVSNSQGHKPTWGIEYMWYNVGDVISTTGTTLLESNVHYPDENVVAYKIYRTALGTGIVGTGKYINSFFSFRGYRNVSDTWTTTIYHLGWQMWYECDTLGADSLLAK